MRSRFLKGLKLIINWILFLAVLITGTAAVYHYTMTGTERTVLETSITGDTVVMAAGQQLHAAVYGKYDAPLTLVFMHGLGNGDCTVSTRPMLEPLSSECQICVIDRPGNGLSKGTREQRSIDVIVSEYRMALHQLGIKGKLILTAHSIAGMYADWWACAYPEEIAGIVYIDATLPEIYAEQGEEPFSLKAASLAKAIGCGTGLQRFVAGDSTLIRRDYKQVFSNRDQELRRMLMYAHTWSMATYREKCAAYQNAVETLTMRGRAKVYNSIPKLYFEADTYHGEYFDTVASRGVKAQYGFTDDAQLAEWVAAADERRQAEYDKIEAFGNVKLVKVSGPHTLYEYAPSALSEEIAAFIRAL